MKIAVDAMGGDRAPGEIVAGALSAVQQLGVEVLLVGIEDAVRAELPDGRLPDGVELQACSQVIDMHDEPGASVRTKKDASVVRCAEAVRDGRADAMVGAGNTGATMASALLRFEHRRDVMPVPVTVTITYAGGNTEEIVVPVLERVIERTIPLNGPIRGIEVNRDNAALAASNGNGRRGSRTWCTRPPWISQPLATRTTTPAAMVTPGASTKGRTRRSSASGSRMESASMAQKSG